MRASTVSRNKNNLLYTWKHKVERAWFDDVEGSTGILLYIDDEVSSEIFWCFNLKGE
jgi:hypothetical protein